MAIRKWLRSFLDRGQHDAIIQKPPTEANGPFSGLVPVAPIVDNKKVIVVIGNCFAESIAGGLKSSSRIYSTYRVEAVPLHIHDLNTMHSREVIARADIVFAQSLSALSRAAVRGAIKDEAEVFWYPDIALRSLWPFDSVNGADDLVAKDVTGTAFTHRDGALAKLRVIEPDKKKRIIRYRNLDYTFLHSLERLDDAQQRFLKEIDEKNDLKIGKFIESGFRETQLFYNVTHPSEHLFREICKQCSQILQPTLAQPSFSGMSDWREWSVPIHPKVAEFHRLHWATATTRYKYGDLGEVTWEEWVEAYINAYG